MKILRWFEWIASVMVMAAIVLGLAKIAVDQVVYVVRHPEPDRIIVRELTLEEKQIYLAEMLQRSDESSQRSALVVAAKMRAEQ